MLDKNQDTYATIDLGSNSFHMIVAKENNGNIVIIDKIREMVRLAGGLNKNGLLSDEAIQNGIQCLEKFGQRLKEIPSSNIRVVGTNTLRKAKNGNKFLAKALTALGHEIDIISGREEARLIYTGVANTIFDDEHKRLVIDIGGGSTEFIIGKNFEPILTESLYMGCVNTTNNYFSDGEINAKRFRKAILFARQELEAVELLYKLESWDLAYGTSGTIRSAHEILLENQWTDNGITLNALKKLRDKLIEFEHIDNIQLNGLNSRRTPVFVGGVAILIGCFEALEIENLQICHGALREGLLYDLVGRKQKKDIRYETVKSMVEQYSLDIDHASRVKNTANQIFEQAKEHWQLTNQDLHILNWACDLHNIGLRVAHSQYHKHGAYLIANSDMAGFSKQEQSRIAHLIRFHRRKLAQEEFTKSSYVNHETQKYLCILLRLAVLLHRSRASNAISNIKLANKKDSLKLNFPDNWLKEHPLTEADLETEANYLNQVEFQLEFS